LSGWGCRWGCGFLCPTPKTQNPQSPIPNPQSPFSFSINIDKKLSKK